MYKQAEVMMAGVGGGAAASVLSYLINSTGSIAAKFGKPPTV